MKPPNIGSLAISDDDPTRPEAVAALVEATYGLKIDGLDRLPIGEGTVNYRARTSAGVLFVKSYLGGTDLQAEIEGIRLSAIAASAGVPTAQPVTAGPGVFIARRGPCAASVWEYVDGQVVESGFSEAQLEAAGAALGTIHRTFAPLPESSGPAPQVDSWLAFDSQEMTATTDQLLAIVTARSDPDDFDAQAERTLRERRAQIGRIPELLAGLPRLTAQVLHGDYSAVNLMFHGDQLAAVVDFRPPDPFLVAYELGRIAYDPRTVMLNPDWRKAARILITAYLEHNPGTEQCDIAFSARAALIQLLTSLYGVKNHYLKSGLLQANLDAFWLLRHSAATTLLADLPSVETDLRAIASLM
ncbi:phosphotransferase enzyme family protein [Nocardia niigatensis]